MPEYVYAIHDFAPENPDEVPFRAGDRIEVIEKDELYQDGWWQGKNPQGHTGLFPQTYTSSQPPVAVPPAVKFPDPGSPKAPHDGETTSTNGATDDRERTLSQGERTMQATLTDVQKAIEQLGRTDGDGSRSFSFASSHGDYTDRSETETDHAESEDEAGTEWHRNARERLAQRAQKDNAERQAREGSGSIPTTPLRVTAPPIDVEVSDESEDEELEDLRHGQKRRSAQTPERHYSSQYPHIPEEDEVEEPPKSPSVVPEERQDTIMPSLPSAALVPNPPSIAHTDESGLIEPSEDFIVPSPSAFPREQPEDDDLRTATADRFPEVPLSSSPDPASLPSTAPSTAPNTTAMPTPIPPAAAPAVEPTPPASEEVRMPGSLNPLTPLSPENESKEGSVLHAPAPSMHSSLSPTIKSVPAAIRVSTPVSGPPRSSAPSPGRPPLPSPGLPMPSPTASSSGSIGVGSAAGIQQTLTPATTMSFQSIPSGSAAQRSDSGKQSGTHPSEWTVEEVVEWLQSKGFDQSICNVFTEQEITGDVLLDLDMNVLKTEFGIIAYGKRHRIVTAISDLRRPPSISESEHPMQPLATSRSQSFNYGHSHNSSMQSSAQYSYNNSPMGYAPSFQQGLSPAASQRNFVAPNTGGSNGFAYGTTESPRYMPVPEFPAVQGNGWRSSDPGMPQPVTSEVSLSTPKMGETNTLVPSGSGTSQLEPAGLGLGLETSRSNPESRAESPAAKSSKNRPANLVLSTSDANLKVTAVGNDQSPNPRRSEDRAAMSDSEMTQSETKSRRRRIFGRSAESASIKEKAGSIKDSASRTSKEGTPITPSEAGKSEQGDDVPPMRRHSKKRSTDERKASDRLSLFGNTFSGTLGKARKPVPRLSVSEKPEKSEHGHHLPTFTRLRGDRKTSGRPSTSDGIAVKERERLEKEKAEREKEQAREDRDMLKPSPSLKEPKVKDPAVLRKRTSSTSDVASKSPLLASQAAGGMALKPGKSIIEQIGIPDHNGWMRKKSDRYNSWKMRYFVLKGPHLYFLKSDGKAETRIKGYINIAGYKVIADESVDPGRYGFKIIHESDKTHYFSHDESITIREWMKALMKATISRDYSNPVVSSSNIPTIPLTVAQAMNPSPRPPSPTARAATQRAHRRDNPNQLTSRDAQVLLMGASTKDKPNGGQTSERPRIESFFTSETASTASQEPATLVTKKPSMSKSSAPPRPSREIRRKFSTGSQSADNTVVDDALVEWANSHLPESLKITDTSGSLCTGLALLRLAEDIKGKPASPPVLDNAFPTSPTDDRLDGLFRLFDFLLDNDVKMGTVSINDIRQGKREKIVQLIHAMRAWEDKRKAIALSLVSPPIAGGSAYMAGPIQYFGT